MRDRPASAERDGALDSGRPLPAWLLAHRLEREADRTAPHSADRTLRIVSDWLDESGPATRAKFKAFTEQGGLRLERCPESPPDGAAPTPVGVAPTAPHVPPGHRTLAGIAANADKAARLLEAANARSESGEQTAKQKTAVAQRKMLADRLRLPIGVPERVRDPAQVGGLPGLILRREVDSTLMAAADLMVHTIDLTDKKESTLKAYWGNTRVLREYFLSRGWDPNRWSYDRVASFCCLYVCYGNKASNLESIRCAWSFCAKADDYVFTHADQARVRHLIKGLIKITDQGHRNYAFPWLYEFTFKAASRWGRRATLKNKRFLAACALRGGTGARGGTSFASPAAAKKRDFNITKRRVTFVSDASGRSVTVHLPAGKGPARSVTFAEIDENPYCTYALLRSWYAASDMKSQGPNAPFFPNISRSGAIDWKKEQSSKEFIAEARAVAAFISLPKKWIARITGHSWRAGCATDLLSRDVAMWKVQLIGGWRSEAVLLYARITPATMAAWTANGQTKAAKPLLPAQFAHLARLNSPVVDPAREPEETVSMAEIMAVARGYMRPLTGTISDRDQMSVDPFISLFS